MVHILNRVMTKAGLVRDDHLEEGGGGIVLLIPRPPLYSVSCGADNGAVLEMRQAVYSR